VTSNATYSRTPQRTPNHRSSEPMDAIATAAAAQILLDPPVARAGGYARRGPATGRGTPDEPHRVMSRAGSCRQAPAAGPPRGARRAGARGRS
jgi:hypothetical protein